MFKVVFSVERDKWLDFVSKNSCGNIFQTPEMFDICLTVDGIEPLKFFVLDGSGEICASMLAYLSTEMRGALKSFSTRAVVNGGPILVDMDVSSREKVLSLLLGEYQRLVCGKALFTEIRNLSDTSCIKTSLEKNGYEYVEHLNFLIDLSVSEEDLWNNLDKSRRYGVRKGREQLSIEEVTQEDMLDEVYSVLKSTYKNAGLPLADFSLFKSAFRLLYPQGIHFFVARDGGEIVGTIVILTYNGVAYDWYAGSLIEYRSMYPNDLLAWHAIQWARQNGFNIFDFGGAGRPDEKYGVRDFKKQFGGSLVNFGRYRKVHSPLKMKLAGAGFNLYKRFM